MDNQSFSVPAQRVVLPAAVPVGDRRIQPDREKRVVDLIRPARTVLALRRVQVWALAQGWPLRALLAASLRVVRRRLVAPANALTIRGPKKGR